MAAILSKTSDKKRQDCSKLHMEYNKKASVGEFDVEASGRITIVMNVMFQRLEKCKSVQN